MPEQTTPAQWGDGRTAYEEFCRKHDYLGLTGSTGSWIWFCRTHAPRVASLGAMRYTKSRRWIADLASFENVVFDLMTKTESEVAK